MEFLRGVEDAGKAAAVWWLKSNCLWMGVVVIVGFIFYKLCQTLPALIRWLVRIFCSPKGIRRLWGWMSLTNIRRIQSLVRWLLRIIVFLSGLTFRLLWIFTFGKGSSKSPKGPEPVLTKVKQVLLGPPGGGPTSLLGSLLGSRTGEAKAPAGPLLQSTK
ncbi:uncharacterized protein LOC144987865 [Oryzias latipes]